MKKSNKVLMIFGISCVVLVLGALFIINKQIQDTKSELIEDSYADNDVIEKDYDIKDFEKLSVEGSVDVDIHKADNFSINAKMTKIKMSNIIIEKNGDTLKIKFKKSFFNFDSNNEKSLVTITMPKLIDIESSGSSDVIFRDFNIDTLTIQASGSTDITGVNTVVKDLYIKGSGSNNVSFKNSKIENADVKLSGSGDVKLDSMIGGILSGSISGSADLEYTGSVKKQTVSTTGSSSVTKI